MNLSICYNNTTSFISIELTDTIFYIKQKIMNTLNIKTKYIDLEFMNAKPIREFGKQALLKGMLERIYDDFTLNEFISNTERELIFQVHCINIEKDKPVQYDTLSKKNFMLNDNDFPPLGK